MTHRLIDYERMEDEIGENEEVYESLLNLSQESAGFQTQMAIGLSLSEVKIISIKNICKINANRWSLPVSGMLPLKSSLYTSEARGGRVSWTQRCVMFRNVKFSCAI